MEQKIKMQFPDTFEEFVKSYSFTDDKEIYTNGCGLIPTFRLKQWEEHKKEEKQQLISFLEDKIKLCDKDIKEFSKNRNVYFRIIEDTKMCKRTYQDVLDFVKKGGKE